ncbi:MAG: peptidoglycan DD-metalloendopeptidase family protein [Rhizobiaceae bacterium]
MSAVKVGTQSKQPVFGKRREPHTIIIAHGNDVSHFTIKPWLTLSIGALLSAMAIGYLLATSYLVFRDDLIGATVARNARIQQAYEDRISALRAQVDRITSRQMLDQQVMESKVAELIDRQEQLSNRGGRLGPLLERANQKLQKSGVPLPASKPGDKVLGAISGTKDGSLFSKLFNNGEASRELSDADRADELFAAINRSIKDIEVTQLAQIRDLAKGAQTTAEDITAALNSAGLPISDAEPTAEGGPYIPAGEATQITAFDKEVERLDQALNLLDHVKSQARRYPIGNPVPGSETTSSFGYRKDPLLGTQAFHSGIDFRGEIGRAIKAPAAGVIVTAGRVGGYGNMVEVRHKGGIITRYGHMNSIYVREGEKIDAGTVIGEVGNTGRSTGPHLHYEVRIDGNPVDPARYLKIGRKIAPFL